MSNPERGIIARFLRIDRQTKEKRKADKIINVEINNFFRPFAKIGKVTEEDIIKQFRISSAGIHAQGKIRLTRLTDPLSIAEGIIIGTAKTIHLAGNNHVWSDAQEPFSLEIELDFHETTSLPYCRVKSKTENITAIEDWPKPFGEHHFYNSFHIASDNKARSIIVCDDSKIIKDLEIIFGLISPESIPDWLKNQKIKGL